VGVPLLALLALLLAPQMPDLMAGGFVGFHADGSATIETWRALDIPVFGTMLGLAGWYWTRAALCAPLRDEDYYRFGNGGPPAGPPPAALPASLVWAPRLALFCGVLTALAPLLVLLWSGRGGTNKIPTITVSLVGVALSACAAFLWTTPIRTWVAKGPLGVLGAGRAAPAWMWTARTTSVLAAGPFGYRFAVAMLAVSVAGGVVIAVLPGLVERNLHTPAAVLVTMGLLIGPLTLSLAVARDIVWWLMGLCLKCWRVIRSPFGGAVPSWRDKVPDWRPPSAWSLASSWGGSVLVIVAILFSGQHYQRPDRYLIRRTAAALHEPVAADRQAGTPFAQGCLTQDGGGATPALPPGYLRRPCLEQAVIAWAAAKRDGGGQGDLPVVIVASEGGASRAAVWTLSAMRELDARTQGQFGQHLFAISAVSGGALGAVSYLQALLAHPNALGGVDWDDPAVRRMINQLGQGDLLGASLATYVFHDTFASLLGVMYPAVDDRGAALERAFERHWAWRQGLGLPPAAAEAGLVESHQAGLAAHPGLPHLVLNGTDRTYGRRAITATFRFRPADDIFTNADDLLTELAPPPGTQRDCPKPGGAAPGYLVLCGQDVPLATAAHNAARFPYVSPAGRYNVDAEPASGRQLLDGGYWENYGARSALELADAVERISTARQLHLVPVVVVISDDADGWADAAARAQELGQDVDPAGADSQLLADVTISCAWHPALLDVSDGAHEAAGRQQALARRTGGGPSAQILAPVLGLYAVRSGHNEDALHLLRRRFCAAATKQPDRLVHIALARPRPSADEAAPMNWVLNPDARSYLVGDRWEAGAWVRGAPGAWPAAAGGAKSFNDIQADTLNAAVAAIASRP
jgi:hypothetical protein